MHIWDASKGAINRWGVIEARRERGGFGRHDPMIPRRLWDGSESVSIVFESFLGVFFFFFLFIFESFFCGQKLYQSRLQHARRPFRHVETREWTWKGFEGAWMERGMSLDHEIWFWATVSIFSLWAFYSFDRLWWWDGGPGKEAELTKWTKRRSKTILWSFWAALMSLLWKHV